jgi:hypothetical protein
MYRHPERALGGVTGPTRQCLDREVDPDGSLGHRHPTANAQYLPPGAPFVPKVSSAGNHQGSHHLTADVVRNRPGRRTGNPPQLLKQ